MKYLYKVRLFMCAWLFATGSCSFVVGSQRSVVDTYVDTCKKRWEKPFKGQEGNNIYKRLFGISTIACKTREPRTASNDALPRGEIEQTDEAVASFLSSVMGDFNWEDSEKAKGFLSDLRDLEGNLREDFAGLLKKCFEQLRGAEKQNPVGVLRLIALVLTSYKDMDSGLVDYLLKLCGPVDISKESARENVDNLFKFIFTHEDFFKQKMVIDSISNVIRNCFDDKDRAAGCQEFSFLCYMQALCEYFDAELGGLIPDELKKFDNLMGTLLGLNPLGINVGYQSSPFADSQKGSGFYAHFAPRTIQLLIPLLKSWRTRRLGQEFSSHLTIDSSAHDLCRILFYFGLVRNVIELFGRNMTISPYGVVTTDEYAEQDWTTNSPDLIRLLFFLSNGCSLADSIGFARNAVTHCVDSWNKFLAPLTLAKTN